MFILFALVGWSWTPSVSSAGDLAPAESPPPVETRVSDESAELESATRVESAESPEPGATDTQAQTVAPPPELAVPSATDDEKPGPARAQTPSEAPLLTEGFRRPSPYLHVAPGIASFNVLDPKYRQYAWGVSGGRSVARGRRFAAQLGGFFEHLAGPRDPAVDLLRFGGEFRVGASNERVFGYGLARTGLDIAVIPKDFYDEPGRRTALFFLLSLGAGIQGALGPRGRFLLGVEPSFDFTWPGVLILFRTRAFVGWRFG
ncbi:hypothetical protein SAMN02745121_08829 [Nannocystis exedens]|uniref:Uncharacterized protein n=1 Tax=Nannocystis exedens TaxID=54 RepID=A0A1I2IQF9_9BACT|nr:hypothetical protein [Nannocystis exedens]PCC68134.1 hypothetical protein NAEX_01143 [Nannocystis exedens]SFF43297.1 hypothetical protein SAMN02745121_08829 [Nannocystis exedens]